jgi:hypothetical protein
MHFKWKKALRTSYKRTPRHDTRYPKEKKTNTEPPKKEREAGKGQEKNLKSAVRCRHYRS